MKIVKCLACKECVHFDGAPNVEKCWNCGAVTDFSRIKTVEEKLLAWCDQTLSRVPFPDLSSPSFRRASKAGILVALPIAAVMLLLCNSLNISIVRDPIDSFASDRIPTDDGGQTGMK